MFEALPSPASGLRIGVALLALVSAHTPVAGQMQPTLELSASRADLPFRLIDNRVVFSGGLGDGGGLTFVLDTGARATAVFGPIGDSLGLTFVGQARVGTGGGGVMAPVAIGESLPLGPNLVIRNETVVALIEEDLPSRLGFHVDALTGAALFTNAVVEVDFDRGLISAHQERPEIPEGAARIPITVEDGGVAYAVLPVELSDGERFDAKFVVDLGQGQSMSLNVGTHPSIVLPDPALHIPAYAVRLDGSSVSGHFGRIAAIHFGPYALRDVVSSFPDSTSQINRAERQGSIGAELLRRFHIVFDYEAGLMYLTPNGSFDDRFDIDMSGLGLQLPDGVITVDRVAPGSPAADADVRPGDRIVEVDGEDAESITLPQLRERLRMPGRTISLTIQRDGETIAVSLELRRRV